VTVENAAPGKDITAEDMATKFPLAARAAGAPARSFAVAGVEFGGPFVPIMAGPNMVESRDMIVELAVSLAEAGASFLRGGAFKPLTFPYRSEKYTETREDGLAWLADAKSASGLPIITEVMEERYLPAVSDVADILQVGSRNMQNFPFLTAVARAGKPVMLKRHFGCSLRDWLGAAEYLLVEGLQEVILCERGVVAPHTHRSTSRFLLDLQVVPAAHEVTHLPIAVDPSHATFWAGWVEPMAAASVAAGADAVMVEVHPDPPNAAVDPLQPIDPAAFGRLVERLDGVAQAVGRRCRG
jgi:3-deoxy-7-phosphoheptulonate synthase